MGSGKMGPENLVGSVFLPAATPPSREAEGGTGDVSRREFLRQELFSALLRSSRGALRHHGRQRGPVRHQGELTCCMTS